MPIVIAVNNCTTSSCKDVALHRIFEHKLNIIYMNIHAKPGTKITVINLDKDVARWGGNDDPTGLLVIGQQYTVEGTEVHSQYTKVCLREVPNKKFNSCHFE